MRPPEADEPLMLRPVADADAAIAVITCNGLRPGWALAAAPEDPGEPGHKASDKADPNGEDRP